MARMFCLLLLALCLLCPAAPAAAEGRLSIVFARTDEGTTSGELWYNERVVWRIRLLADGAETVSGPASPRTTVLAPAVEDGQFLLKIYTR